MIMTFRHVSYFLLLVIVFGLYGTNAEAKSLSFDLFADIEPQSTVKGLNVNDAISYEGHLYFSANSLDTGRELWIKSPGSTADILFDINPGPDDSSPRKFKVVGQFLYFLATDSDGISKLWKINSDNQMELVHIEHPQGMALAIKDYLIDEQGVYILSSLPGSTIQLFNLWYYSHSSELSLIDDTVAQSMNFAEVSNLFIFNEDLFLFLYSDAEFDLCLLRRYPGATNSDLISSGLISDIECSALSYHHQMQLVNNKVYFRGKQHLLEFDGISALQPVLDGNAKTGDLAVLGDTLYVASELGHRGTFNEMPFVYSIDDSGMSVVIEPSDPDSQQASIDFAITTYDDKLIVAQGKGFWAGDYWQGLSNHVFSFLPGSEEIDVLAESSSSQNYINYIRLLRVDSGTVCLGGFSLFCLDDSGNLSLLTENVPASSDPRQLTVLNHELYFNAYRDGQWALWKADGQQNTEFLQQGYFEGLTTWHGKLFFQRGIDDFYYFDDSNNAVFINEAVPDYPQNVIQVSFGSEAIYLLSRNSDDFELWRFDGESSVSLVLNSPMNNGQPVINAFNDELYLSFSRIEHPSETIGQCSVYREIQGELVLLAEKSVTQTPDQESRCESRVYESQGRIFAYFEYFVRNVPHSSVAELSRNNDEPVLSWWWQERPIEIHSSYAFFYHENGLYFCGRAETINGRYFDLLRISPDWQPRIVDNFCLDSVVVSDFSGSSQVYGVTTSKNGLYQVNDTVLEKVTGINGVYVGDVTDATEYNNNLILSSRFRDSEFSYGHELVRVSVINDPIQFLAENGAVSLLMEANSGSFELGSILSVSDSDEADNVIWDLMESPDNGSINGLPYQTMSDGLPLTPEAVTYQPHSGFIGRDSFAISVTDRFSESIINVDITVSQSSSEPTVVDTQNTSGGSMGWLFACILIIARRLRNNAMGWR